MGRWKKLKKNFFYASLTKSKNRLSGGTTTLSITKFSIMTLSITTFSIMTINITTFSIMTFSVMAFSIMTLSITSA
jgi:hypothetical protein